MDLVGTKRYELRQMISDGKFRDANKDNTLIIYVTSESPYAEWMGDINNPFCWDTTEWVEGCIYNAHANTYMPDLQKTTLNMGIDDFSKNMINDIRFIDSDIPMVSVLMSGRPMIVDEILEES